VRKLQFNPNSRNGISIKIITSTRKGAKNKFINRSTWNIKTKIMTTKEKIYKKGYNLYASYNNGIRKGYFAKNHYYDIVTKTYKTQTELLNSLTIMQ